MRRSARACIAECIAAIMCLSLWGCRPGPAKYEETRLLMDTIVRVQVWAPTEAGAREAARAALAEIERLDQLWNAYDPGSEVSRINAQAGQGPVAVHADTFSLLETALAVARLSGGAFDPTIAPLVKTWGFGNQPHLPPPAEISDARRHVDFRAISLDQAAGTVSLTRPGMSLDLGAIAKGYAVDRAVAILRERGISSALVTAGGSVYGLGTRPGGVPWRVAIQHPRQQNGTLGTICIQDGAVDTSGDYQRYFEADGTRYHHILDPRTGRPARGCQSVTITGPEATWADALATAVFVLGPEEGLALVGNLPGYAALVVDSGGNIHVSPGLTWEATAGAR